MMRAMELGYNVPMEELLKAAGVEPEELQKEWDEN